MSKPVNDGKPWKPQITRLKSDVRQGMDTIDIARDLGRTEDAVRQEAHKLHLSLKKKGNK